MLGRNDRISITAPLPVCSGSASCPVGDHIGIPCVVLFFQTQNCFLYHLINSIDTLNISSKENKISVVLNEFSIRGYHSSHLKLLTLSRIVVTEK